MTLRPSEKSESARPGAGGVRPGRARGGPSAGGALSSAEDGNGRIRPRSRREGWRAAANSRSHARFQAQFCLSDPSANDNARKDVGLLRPTLASGCPRRHSPLARSQTQVKHASLSSFSSSSLLLLLTPGWDRRWMCPRSSSSSLFPGDSFSLMFPCSIR